jgi:hypothetical protein
MAAQMRDAPVSALRRLRACPRTQSRTSRVAAGAMGRYTMTRFLFQANYLGLTLTDDIGELFSTLREAEAHAAIVARELSRNSPHRVTVFVLTQDGTVLTSTAAETE